MKYQHAATAVLSMIGIGSVCAASSSENPPNADELAIKIGDVYLAASSKSPPNANKSEIVKDQDCAFGRHCRATPPRSNNFWVSGDLLLWTVCEDGFSCEFGDTVINTTIVDNTPTTAITEHDKDFDTDWRLGFRVGVGVDLPCSGWDTEAYWTHYYGKGDGHDHHNHAHWWLHFNVADATFGRKFWVGSCVDLRPFAGLRYAQIKQGLRTRLETEIIAATGDSTVITRIHDEQKFWGLGPQLGLEANFYVANRLSLYGSLAGAILYGHTDTTFDDSDSFALANNICTATSTSCTDQMVLDVAIGIRYEFKYLTLQAGLEHHNYFGYNSIGCCGNLNLYGANFSAAVHF